MAEIYVLDSSALQTLNDLAVTDDSLTDQLIDLRDKGRVTYCEAAKNERRQFAKGEPVTIWATSGWRSLQSTATVTWDSIAAVLQHFAAVQGQQNILDEDETDADEQQALVSISLAYQLRDDYEVIVVSDEDFTVENRCTVIEACTVLGVSHLSVKDFLQAAGINLVTPAP